MYSLNGEGKPGWSLSPGYALGSENPPGEEEEIVAPVEDSGANFIEEVPECNPMAESGPTSLSAASLSLLLTLRTSEALSILNT